MGSGEIPWLPPQVFPFPLIFGEIPLLCLPGETSVIFGSFIKGFEDPFNLDANLKQLKTL